MLRRVQNSNMKYIPLHTEIIELAVLGHFQVNNTQSIKTGSIASGTSRSSVHRILRKHKIHPFKMILVQVLNEDDFDGQIQFCKYFIEPPILESNYRYNTCLSDECWFILR